MKQFREVTLYDGTKKKFEVTKCPVCGEVKLYVDEAMNALSRKDGKTYICSDCGRDEAFLGVKRMA